MAMDSPRAMLTEKIAGVTFAAGGCLKPAYLWPVFINAVRRLHTLHGRDYSGLTEARQVADDLFGGFAVKVQIPDSPSGR